MFKGKLLEYVVKEVLPKVIELAVPAVVDKAVKELFTPEKKEKEVVSLLEKKAVNYRYEFSENQYEIIMDTFRDNATAGEILQFPEESLVLNLNRTLDLDYSLEAYQNLWTKNHIPTFNVKISYRKTKVKTPENYKHIMDSFFANKDLPKKERLTQENLRLKLNEDLGIDYSRSGYCHLWHKRQIPMFEE